MNRLHEKNEIRPMTGPQLSLINTLRIQKNISEDVIDRLCKRHFDVPLAEINVRQATTLITSLKAEPSALQREIQVIAGQQSMFGDDL